MLAPNRRAGLPEGAGPGAGDARRERRVGGREGRPGAPGGPSRRQGEKRAFCSWPVALTRPTGSALYATPLIMHLAGLLFLQWRKRMQMGQRGVRRGPQSEEWRKKRAEALRRYHQRKKAEVRGASALAGPVACSGVSNPLQQMQGTAFPQRPLLPPRRPRPSRLRPAPPAPKSRGTAVCAGSGATTAASALATWRPPWSCGRGGGRGRSGRRR